MKRLIAMVLALVMALSLVACGKETPKYKISGNYNLKSFTYKGITMDPSPDSISSETNISVTNEPKGIFYVFQLVIDGEYDIVEGTMEEMSRSDDLIKYKCWVNKQLTKNNLSSMDYFYVQYDSVACTIEIEIDGGTFHFSQD